MSERTWLVRDRKPSYRRGSGKKFEVWHWKKECKSYIDIENKEDKLLLLEIDDIIQCLIDLIMRVHKLCSYDASKLDNREEILNEGLLKTFIFLDIEKLFEKVQYENKNDNSFANNLAEKTNHLKKLVKELNLNIQPIETSAIESIQQKIEEELLLNYTPIEYNFKSQKIQVRQREALCHHCRNLDNSPSPIDNYNSPSITDSYLRSMGIKTPFHP